MSGGAISEDLGGCVEVARHVWRNVCRRWETSKIEEGRSQKSGFSNFLYFLIFLCFRKSNLHLNININLEQFESLFIEQSSVMSGIILLLPMPL